MGWFELLQEIIFLNTFKNLFCFWNQHVFKHIEQTHTENKCELKWNFENGLNEFWQKLISVWICSEIIFYIEKASSIVCDSFSYQKLKWVDKNTLLWISKFSKLNFRKQNSKQPYTPIQIDFKNAFELYWFIFKSRGHP